MKQTEESQGNSTNFIETIVTILGSVLDEVQTEMPLIHSVAKQAY